MVSPRLLRSQDAAQYIGVSYAALRKLRSVGGGPDFIKSGKFVRYKIEDLDKWIDSKSVYSSCAAYRAGVKERA